MAIPGVLILLGLGSWQVQRLIWKNEANEFRTAQAQAEPMPLPLEVDIDALAFRPVWVEGRFLHAQEMFLAARSHKSQTGYQVITPFETADGRAVLINRGWIPLDRKEPSTRAEGQVEGVVRIEGLIVPGGRPGWFTPDNRPDENFWFWVDLDSLAAHAGIPPQRYLIDAGPAPNPGGLPIGGQTRVELRNEHFQYIVIWYALAVGLATIYVLFMRGERRRAQQSEPD